MAQIIKKNAQLLFILGLALLLRLISINQSLWLDEASTGMVAREGVRYYLHDFAPKDFHPPLHYLVSIVTVALFGARDVVLRLPSVIFGVGTVAVVYRIAQRLKPQFSWLPALFLATAPLHIYYSQEARMYSQATFFISLAALAFLKLQVKEWQRELRHQSSTALLFVFSLSAAFLTHYLTLLMIPVFILAARNRRLFLKLTGVSLAPLLLWLPLLLQQLMHASTTIGDSWGGVLGKVSLKNVALIPIKFLIGRVAIEPQWLYGLSMLLVSYLICMIVLQNQELKQKHRFFLIWLLMPPLITTGVSLFVPMLQYFRLLFVLPAMYVLIAFGIASLKRRRSQLIATIFVLSLNIWATQKYLTYPEYHREPWKGVIKRVQDISAQSAKSAVIFTMPNLPAPWEWYQPNGVAAYARLPGQLQTVPLAQLQTVFVFEYLSDIFDPQGTIKTGVEEHGFTHTGQLQFRGIGIVQLYSKPEVFAISP